jgi:hypothetical protein
MQHPLYAKHQAAISAHTGQQQAAATATATATAASSGEVKAEGATNVEGQAEGHVPQSSAPHTSSASSSATSGFVLQTSCYSVFVLWFVGLVVFEICIL